MSNINGGGARRNMMSSVDFYRRVPKDLTEVRKRQCWSWSFPCRILRTRSTRVREEDLSRILLEMLTPLLFPLLLLYLYLCNTSNVKRRTSMNECMHGKQTNICTNQQYYYAPLLYLYYSRRQHWARSCPCVRYRSWRFFSFPRPWRSLAQRL
jgi:hypothetical protein